MVTAAIAAGLQVKECGRLELASSSSAKRVLIVVVPGHTHVPSSGLKQLHDELQLLLPEAVLLVAGMSHLHHGEQTALREDDIDFAALQLSQEISSKLDKIEHDTGMLFALSFWCLGTGGLIARAALSWLTSRQDKLLTYVSLGTPHLGLFLPGLSWWYWWRVSLWRSCCSSPLWLEQVTHSEGRRVRGSRLFRLCSADMLSSFRRIIFIGSGTDFLVPLSSSALQGVSCDANKVTPVVAPPDLLNGAPSSKVLLILLPILWLARLRAWSVLLALLAAVLAALLLPSPPGHFGRRLDSVKMQFHDFFKTVRGELEPGLDRDLAQLFLSTLPAEKLLKVEVWPNKRSWRFRQGFGSDVLYEHEWIKAMVARYGPSLIATREEKSVCS
ncbi:ndc80 [Symbiodinium natans]|uniref:Ndc80 protein n=1 Tax=Symbiodinium natans TaxID=878477 RepID=A0A812IBI7_9DINO|nr:ndc80 [Symbiodinium natans]